MAIATAVSLFASPLGSVYVRAEMPESNETQDDDGLTQEQANELEMLNYITVLTQEINASSNSRVYMEEAYSNLINNTYPNAVNDETLSYMTGLLDTMEHYRMIDVKRERLHYIYEQSQAEAIRSAIPNPMGLISAVHSFDPIKLVTSVVYMAVDSATSYNAYTSEIEKEYLQDGWTLDDEEAAALHESRKGAFTYMIRMVNDNNLPGDLTLTESTVKDFVDFKKDTVTGRIRSLESSQKVYASYGGYWLILSESYYQNKNYKKCIEALDHYESIGTRILRKDFDYANILPLAIAAAKETMSIKDYAPYASARVQAIVDNTNYDDWALRYFGAQTYVDLYAETKDKAYLEKAYEIVVDNINYLKKEQLAQNEAYSTPIKELEKEEPKKPTKEQKEEIKNYNKMIKEARDIELPPVYEPLVLNCELLFALADEMKIDSAKKNEIDGILHPSGKPIILVKPIDDEFRFAKSSDTSKATCSISSSGISIPAAFVTKDSVIKVTVYNSDGSNAGEITDWTIKEVTRENDKDITTHKALYISDTFKKFNFVPDQKVVIDVVCWEGLEVSYQFVYYTEGTKNQWYDYGKVWEKSIKFVTGK